MRSRSAVPRLVGYAAALLALELAALSLVQCAAPELPLPPRPDVGLVQPAPAVSVAVVASAAPPPAQVIQSPDAAVPELPPPEVDAGRCADVPPLGPDGAVPKAPPHAPLGEEVDVPGDRSVYVLPGNPEDSRVIIYLHGMCGDVTAADYFREAVRAHGTLLALRGDTHCYDDRFKWRADSATIQARIRAAFQRVNETHGGQLRLEPALLVGYSQGADRAEKLAQHFPKQYPRIVLGGPPMKASPLKLAKAQRVAILGGELETTDTMRAGFDALQAAGIASRFITLDCAYHGYFGSNAETQLGEVLDWLSEP